VIHSAVRNFAGGRAIRVARVCDLTGASRATVWRWVHDDVGFPRPFKLSERVTCWDEGEVLAWIEAKKAQRRVSP
jgi:predicted DNA-binding transcriptional regulator AlpA